MSLATLPPLRGELREREPMAGHVSWRAGGPAALWFRPADAEDLATFLAAYEGEVLPVGLGSNLLVRDGGWPGAVIILYDVFTTLDIDAQSGRVETGAGVHCATLATQCAKAGLAGATFFGGIPGSIGGALAMNAGAWGGETWEVVEGVEVLHRDGRRERLDAQAFETGYRHARGPSEALIYLAATLALRPGGDVPALRAELREMLAERRAKQPVGQPSCGSVFRNPEGDHAAALIERCGLKGHRIGEAEVSTKHANFILNRGAARAADIEALLLEVQRRVAESTGIRLQPEVRIVGEAA